MTKIGAKYKMNLIKKDVIIIMKIEKVNDQQIRCTLTREDLANRELKISELAYGTEKAKSLFRDMMRQAAYECGFEAEDIPLMIEAIPLNSECIVLIITKVEDPEELDTRFSKFAPSVHEDEDYDEDESADITETFANSADEMLNMLRKMSGSASSDSSDRTASVSSDEPAQRSTLKGTNEAQPASRLFSFATLNDVTRLAHVAASSYKGDNTLYKDETNGSYLLLLTPARQNAAEFNRVCNLISEYGKPEKSVLSARAYLEEHYEPLIREHAMEALAQI